MRGGILPCFNTQPPEGGWFLLHTQMPANMSFNTQPPEGGWAREALIKALTSGFNTQPPEGGWPYLRGI